jgi:hypothetical protein
MQRQTTTSTDLWTYRDYDTWEAKDISGFAVEAVDGEIGSVDEATYDAGTSFIVVDTGPWIFGRKVLLPAGVLTRVDHPNRRVFVNRSKEQIENAPEFDEASFRDMGYRESVGDYYGSGRGYRDWS